MFTSEALESVELIDFGSLTLIGETAFTYLQSRYYRAPEVVIGLELSPAVDIWSIGCIAAELMLGLPLFPAVSQTHLMVLMNEMLGPFPRGMAEGRYFTEEGDLKSAEILESEFNEDWREFRRYFVKMRIEDIVMSLAVEEEGGREREIANRRVFLDLVKKMLELDPSERITAADAMEHPFLHMDL